MSSNDRAKSLIVALGLALTAACGGEQFAGDAEDVGANGLSAEGAVNGVTDDAPGAEELVEKGGSILSSQPASINYGTLGFGESVTRDWIVASSERTELVTAVDVPPFDVEPLGCAVIEPTDPSLRRCVFHITFSPPGQAGTFRGTIFASDIDGNTTSVDLVGVGEAVILP